MKYLIFTLCLISSINVVISQECEEKIFGMRILNNSDPNLEINYGQIDLTTGQFTQLSTTNYNNLDLNISGIMNDEYYFLVEEGVSSNLNREIVFLDLQSGNENRRISISNDFFRNFETTGCEDQIFGMRILNNSDPNLEINYGQIDLTTGQFTQLSTTNYDNLDLNISGIINDEYYFLVEEGISTNLNREIVFLDLQSGNENRRISLSNDFFRIFEAKCFCKNESQIQNIPTTSEWGVVILALIFMICSVQLISNRKLLET